MKFRMLLGAFCLFTIVHGDNIFAAVPIGLDLQLDDAFKKEGETTSIFLAGLETNWENNGVSPRYLFYALQIDSIITMRTEPILISGPVWVDLQ